MVPGGGAGLGMPVAVEGPDGEIGEHAHGGVEERDVDITADPRALGVEEADHETDHGGIASREIDDGDPALAGGSVRLARYRHVPGIALDQVVVGGLVRAGCRGAEAREGAVDKPWIDGP